METPLAAFLIALGTVALAEMGDKTQMLVMTLAAKYSPAKVLAGVLAAVALLNAIAVAAGSLLARYSAIGAWIQLAVSVSFVAFALWTLRGEKPEEEKRRETRFGPAATAAASFFVAELGDKTQLATLALAAKFPGAPASVFLGSSLGLLAADGLGIFVGVAFCRRIPEKVFRYISAAAFFLFGLFGIWQMAPGSVRRGNRHGYRCGGGAYLGAHRLAHREKGLPKEGRGRIGARQPGFCSIIRIMQKKRLES